MKATVNERSTRKVGFAMSSLATIAVGACLIVFRANVMDAQSEDQATPEPPPTRLESRNKEYVIEMRDNNDSSAEYDEEQLLVISRNGREIVTKKTFGYFSGEAYWNDSGTLVAINNRRGNSGDYVWIFSLPDGKCLKTAESEQFDFLEEAAAKTFQRLEKRAVAKDLDKYWIYARGWLGDDKTLLINVHSRYSFKSKKPDFPSFEYDALVRVSESRFELVWGEGRKVERNDE